MAVSPRTVPNRGAGGRYGRSSDNRPAMMTPEQSAAFKRRMAKADTVDAARWRQREAALAAIAQEYTVTTAPGVMRFTGPGGPDDWGQVRGTYVPGLDYQVRLAVMGEVGTATRFTPADFEAAAAQRVAQIYARQPSAGRSEPECAN